MAEKDRSFNRQPKRFISDTQQSPAFTPEDLDALNEDDIETLGTMLMRMFSGAEKESVAPKQAPRAKKVLDTIDRGLERIGNPEDLMPGMGTYRNLESSKRPSMDFKQPPPMQPSPMRNQTLSPPVMGRMPARASRQIKSMLQNRYNQFKQPSIYSPLGAQQPMMQQSPLYMFDPTQAR
jgi:hypothetical protein